MYSSTLAPDHFRVGGSLYYLTWPRLVIFCAALVLSVLVLTAAPDYLVDADEEQLGSGVAPAAVIRTRKQKTPPRKLKTGIMPTFCDNKRGNFYLAKWKPAVLSTAGWPSEHSADIYCDWKDKTSTQIPFKMCTFDRNRDTQVSAYIHKEGHWSGSKKEIFERILPKVQDGMQWPERTMVIDIGATVGFYTAMFATLGYDVISLEPSKEAVIRMLFSLQANGIRIARSGADVAVGSGTQRKPVVYAYNNAAADGYNSLFFHYVEDNVGASFMTVDPPGEEVTSVFLDDILDAKSREPSSKPPALSSAPVLDPTTVRAIKISAEGWDSRALHGMRRLLSLGKVPYVLFVYNKDHVTQRGCDADALVYSLFDWGYRIYFAGIYIYREQELKRFMKGMVSRSTELLFVGPGAEVM